MRIKCACGFLLSALAAFGQVQPQLYLEQLTFPTGSTVQFVVDYQGNPPPDATATLGPREGVDSAQTDDARYSLFSDMESTSFRGVAYYYFNAYLHDHVRNTWEQFRVKALPIGPFADQYADIRFTVVRGSATSPGRIRFPVFNPRSDQQALVLAPRTKYPEIQLAPDNPMELQVRNGSEQMSIRIVTLTASAERKNCWNGLAVTARPPDLAPNAQGTVGVEARPNFLPALFRSVLNRQPDAGDDSVKIEGEYRSLPGGPVRKLSSVFVPVRFVPSAGTLLLVLVSGVTIGALIAVLPEFKRSELKPDVKWYFAAVGLASVAELIGIAFVAAGSKFELFGVALDPATVPGAALIGVGFGFRCLSRKKLPAFLTDWPRRVLPLLLFCSLLPALHAAHLDFRPIALASDLAGNRVYALAYNGFVYELAAAGKTIRASKTHAVPSRNIFAVTAARIDGAEGLLALEYVRGAGAFGSGVTRYWLCPPGAAARPLLNVPGFVGDVAPDAGGASLWIADSVTKEISRSSLTGKRKYLATVAAAKTLGALAYDAAHGVLFAADPVDGKAFAIDAATAKCETIADRLGEPRSIAVDGNRLLIADASGSRIWAVAPAAARKARAKVFSQLPKGSDPSGIVIHNRQVWIADSGKNEVYVLSAEGERIM